MNPFLKKKTNDIPKRNPLCLTDVTSDLNLPSTSGLQTEKKNEKETSTSFTPSSSQNQGETFVSWFTKEKSDLQEKHPNLSPLELTQIALKLYKKQSEKRKAMEEAEGGKAKQPKLSDFAFSKRT